ncbi:hypothetical protein WJS89_09560 [Sphingomicrobium sp. XHP0235]|uniref:hypothetical protein n=1 Tax=Sphingomicrobium aquimarinum TaxID=3133971 RepID=UPI0031FE563C
MDWATIPEGMEPLAAMVCALLATLFVRASIVALREGVARFPLTVWPDAAVARGERGFALALGVDLAMAAFFVVATIAILVDVA